MKHAILSSMLMASCSAAPAAAPSVATPDSTTTAPAATPVATAAPVAAGIARPITAAAVLAPQGSKLTDPSCFDPDMSKIAQTVSFTLCNGTTGTGTLVPAVVAAPAPAADLSNLTPGNVKTGVSVAGVLGTYAGLPQPDLTTLSPGNVRSGVIIANVAGTFTGPTPPDLSLLVPANLKAGITINGVTGTMVTTAAPANCTANAQVNCVTTSSFKAADFTNLVAGNLKAGVGVAGVTGGYPSSTYPLVGAAGTELDLASFDARIKSSANFSWFDSTGTRYVGAGDANITAANLVTGVSVFGTAGTATASPVVNAFDLRYGVTVGATTGALQLDCQNSGDAIVGSPYMCAASFVDESPTSCTTTAMNCQIKEKVSQLHFAHLQGALTLPQAKSLCAGMSMNGLSTWRVPSQEEAHMAGQRQIVNPSVGTYFWNGQSSLTTYVWTVSPAYGQSTLNQVVNMYTSENLLYNNTTGTAQTLCVHN